MPPPPPLQQKSLKSNTANLHPLLLLLQAELKKDWNRYYDSLKAAIAAERGLTAWANKVKPLIQSPASRITHQRVLFLLAELEAKPPTKGTPIPVHYPPSPPTTTIQALPQRATKAMAQPPRQPPLPPGLPLQHPNRMIHHYPMKRAQMLPFNPMPAPVMYHRNPPPHLLRPQQQPTTTPPHLTLPSADPLYKQRTTPHRSSSSIFASTSTSDSASNKTKTKTKNDKTSGTKSAFTETYKPDTVLFSDPTFAREVQEFFYPGCRRTTSTSNPAATAAFQGTSGGSSRDMLRYAPEDDDLAVWKAACEADSSGGEKREMKGERCGKEKSRREVEEELWREAEWWVRFECGE